VEATAARVRGEFTRLFKRWITLSGALA